MPVVTLKQAIIHFGLNEEVYQNIINRVITAQIQSKKDFNEIQKHRMKDLIDLKNGTATKSTLIAFVINHISYLKELVKYDIINNGQDVIIHYNNKNTESW